MSVKREVTVRIYTQSEFESLTPYQRGYVVYWCGDNPKQVNVPNECNPYIEGTDDFENWNKGQRQATQDAQDSEE